MRALKIAAIVGIGMGIAGVALAGPWNDPAGRVSFNAPSGWVTQVQRAAASQTVVLTGNANNECYVITAQNAGTASATPHRLHTFTDAMAAADWQALANSVRPMFPNGGAQVTSQSVDTAPYWPIQRAQLSGAERPVTAALSHRPGGLDLIALCWSYGGPDPSATFETFFHSIANSNDATWQTASEQQGEQQAAQQQAAQQQTQQHQQPQQQSQQQTQRNNRLDRHGEGPALGSPH